MTIVDNEVLGNVTSCDPMPCAGGAGLWSAEGGSVHAVRSILAGNTSRFGPPDSTGPDCAGMVVSAGFNAVQDSSGCELVPPWNVVQPWKRYAVNDFLGVDPGLRALHDSLLLSNRFR